MRIKRNWILVILLSLVALIGLIGCNSESSTDSGNANNDPSGNNESSNDGSTNEEQEQITLQFWGGVPADAGPQAVVDDWNENNPNVQVEYNRYVNDDAGNLKLNTALQTGQNVDIFVSYGTTYLEDRVNSNFAVDLSQFDDYDIDSKMGEKAEQWKINDAYYAVPTTQGTNLVFINKDALDEAGLDVPEEWTWEELREYAKQLTTEDRIGFINFDPHYNANINSALADEGWVNEDGKSNFEHPQIRKGIEIVNEMMNTDNSMMPLGERVATGVAADHMFLNGEAAMLYTAGGTWLFRTTNNLEEYPRDFKIAFAPQPHFEGTSNIGVGLGDGLSIASNSEYKDEAWEFIKWYADEGMLHQASGGRIPASKDASIEEAMSLMVEGVEDTYDLESLENLLSNTDGVLMDPLPLQVTDTLKQELERYYIGEQSIDEAINSIVERHNQIME